tara:strand:- start:1232 stop:1354 length:123 start_codon:yes stop_codon:yes gene_type:complete
MEKNVKNKLKSFDNCALTNQNTFSAKHEAKFTLKNKKNNI